MDRDAATAYDDLPYDDLAIHHTHPAHLATVAALAGLVPPPVRACRVLELGCGTGHNLLAMSRSLPGAQFVGVDLSRRQVADARAAAERIGASNVEFVAGDVAARDESLGGFDYVIAHGLLSWVPAPVREAVLRTVRARLRPDGIGYLSYNTLPGWHQRGVLRTILRFHDPAGAPPRERVRRAREGLERTVASIGDDDADYARLVRREAESLRADSDAYVLHEFLADENHAFPFAEFAARAAAHGLRWVAEARWNTNAAVQTGDVRRALDGVSADPLVRESYLDLLQNRHFRQSVVGREGNRPAPEAARPARDGLVVLASVESLADDGDGTPGFRLGDGREVRTDDPATVAALRALAERGRAPVPFGTVAEGAAPALAADLGLPLAIASEAVAAVLVSGYAAGAWRLWADVPPAAGVPGDRPRACALARDCAARFAPVTNLLHLPVDVSAADRDVLVRLDGATSGEAIAGDLGRDPEEVRATVARLAAASLLDRA